MGLTFNAVRFVADCGGVTTVATALGHHRTYPYRSMRTGYFGTPTLARLLEQNPNLNLNNYFEDDKDGENAD